MFSQGSEIYDFRLAREVIITCNRRALKHRNRSARIFRFARPAAENGLFFLALWGALVYNKGACSTLCAQARRPAVSRVRRAHDITKGSFPVPLMRLYFSSKFKKNLFPVLTISITFGFVLYFLLSNGGAQNLGQILLRLRWEWLGLAVFAVVLTFALEGVTLHLFCRHVCPWWTLGRSVSIGMTGLFYSAITPFSTGGQPMQIYAMRRMGMDTGKAGSVIAMKTLVYQIVMVLYSLLLVFTQLGFFQQNISNFSFITVIGLLSNSAFIGAVLLFTVSARGTDRALRFFLRLLYRLRIVRRPLHRYSRIHVQMSVFHKSAGLMGRSFRLYCTTALLTVVQITVQSLISWFIYKSFALAGEQVPVITMVAAQVFVSMVSAFVPLPGASGGAEGSFVLFFGKFFGQDIVAAMFLWRLLTYYVNIAFGGLFSVWGGKKYQAKTEEKT